MPIVLGLRGLAGAGKSTVALHLAMTGLFEQHSLAAPMRHGFRAMGITKAGTPDLYRRFMQDAGAALRAHNENHWVDMSKLSLRQCLLRGRHAVLDDVRFPNEAALCDLIVYLRPEGFAPLDLGERAGHASEAWNRAYDEGDPSGESDPPSALVLNRKGQLPLVSEEILQLVTKASPRARPWLTCDIRQLIYPSQEPTGGGSHAGGGGRQPHPTTAA